MLVALVRATWLLVSLLWFATYFFLASHSYSRALFLGPCCLFVVRAFISVATLVRRFAPHDNRESLCPLYWQKLWSLGVSIQDVHEKERLVGPRRWDFNYSSKQHCIGGMANKGCPKL